MTEEYTFRKGEAGFKPFAELLTDYDFYTIFEAYAKPFYAMAKGFYEGYQNKEELLKGDA
jgi:hypothetical protein